MVCWAAQIAIGCDYCTNLNNVFTVAHPRSIEIALATRKAIDDGKLSNDIMVSDGVLAGRRNAELAKYPARLIVKQWADSLASKNRLPLRIHLLFVDTRETCELILRGSIATYSDDSTGRSDARIVTTRKTIHEIAAGRLTLHEALRLKVAFLESDEASPLPDVLVMAKR